MSALLTLVITVGNLYCVHAVFNNCSWIRRHTEVNVNCSGRHLASIPPLNDSVTYLDLSHNEITRIKFNTTLKNLKFLDISWNNIRSIDKTSFVSLRKLQFLDLSHCSIRNVDEGVFGEMTELKYLNISYNRELGFASLPNITLNLNKTKLLSLNLNAVNCRSGRSTIIKLHHLQNIKNTNITELYLANNRMELLQPGVIHNLPKSIEIFTMSENKLTNGPYLLEIPQMSNLKVFDMSLQRNLLVGETFENQVFGLCQEKVDTALQNDITENIDHKFKFNVSLPLPPNLESLFIHSNRAYGEDYNYSVHAGKLKHVYMQNNFIVSFGHIEAKDNIVETLDISNNYCSHWRPFKYGQHLKHFNMSHNDLSQDLEKDSEGEVFNSFINLEVLDISFNKISSLPRLLLKTSNKLKYIYASNNRLTDWSVDITEMINLTLLDLSENKLATINEHTRNNFKNVFLRQNLTLDLSRNDIMCTCENKKYMQWIVKFQKHFLNIQNYSCTMNTAGFDFKTLDSSLDLLLKHCTSYTGWYIGGAVSFAILFSFIIGSALVKNKWKIRYLIYKSKQRLRLKVTSYKHMTNNAYDYDAFISYCGGELMFILKEIIPRMEVNSNLKLLIRDRDYLPGIPKVDSIMSSLQESKRTICIVSKKYLVSKWRDYELNMAKVEGIKDRGTLNYVILILLPEVYNGGYPNKIMDLVRKDRYIEYPMESCAYDDFWDRLIRMTED